MDYLLYYVEVGLIANAISFALDFIIGLYLVFSLGLVETAKFEVIAEENLSRSNLWVILHFLIPFFNVYLIIIQIILIRKYFNGTADSLDFMIKELDKYRIFRRFK